MKRTRVRLDRNVPPCSRPTTAVIDPLHECKKVCPCRKALPLSGSCAWIKQGRKKRKKRGRETGKTEAKGWWKERQPNKTKTYLRNENKAYLLRHRLRLTKKGERRMWPLVPGQKVLDKRRFLNNLGVKFLEGWVILK